MLLAMSLTRAFAENKPGGHPANERLNSPQTFSVTSTGNSGNGSLAKAITDANNNPGQDTIEFHISGSGVKTISLTSALPIINESVTIDGTTQGAGHLIVINGSGISGNVNGLNIQASNVTVRGLVINGFSQAGIGIDGNFSGNSIVANYLGTNAAGTSASGNGNGITVNGGHGNTIGGTNGTTPGGACTGDCNLLSGNGNGIILLGGTTQNQVLGNFIGTNVNGTNIIHNSFDGILISGANNNTVGNGASSGRNIISGNTDIGVELGSGAQGNLIQGNYIGTNTGGTGGLGNGPGSGIMIATNAKNNTIGGAGAGNLISANNGFGILLFPGSTGNKFYGNMIGVTANGSGALGNTSQGIEIQSSSNIVGAITAGMGNVINNNGREGVHIKVVSGNPVKNAIRGNSIFSNVRFGINLGQDGLTPNDAGDGDSGANNLQNFPTLTSATSDGSNLNVVGTLNSYANGTFDLDFFRNPKCDDPVFSHQAGEGKTYLGSTTVTTNGSGNASFNLNFPGSAPVGSVVTATATDAAGNTSEFSYCVTVQSGVAIPPVPVLVSPPNGSTVNTGPVLLKWNPSPGATYYKVLVRQGSGTGPTMDSNENWTSTQYTTQFSLASGLTYFWRIVACNSAGCNRTKWWTMTAQ